MNEARSGSHLRIGDLASELALNPKTIRYYEEIGLLPAPQRSAGGYRLYGAADRERLRFIAKAKAIGFTLQQIGDILALRDEGAAPCSHVLDLLDRRLCAVEAQLRALTEVRQDLLALRQEAATTSDGSAQVCAIIEHHKPVHEPSRASS